MDSHNGDGAVKQEQAREVLHRPAGNLLEGNLVQWWWRLGRPGGRSVCDRAVRASAQAGRKVRAPPGEDAG